MKLDKDWKNIPFAIFGDENSSRAIINHSKSIIQIYNLTMSSHNKYFARAGKINPLNAKSNLKEKCRKVLSSVNL